MQEKKKKKSKTQNADLTFSWIQTGTKGPFGLNLFLLKLKTETENTIAK